MAHTSRHARLSQKQPGLDDMFLLRDLNGAQSRIINDFVRETTMFSADVHYERRIDL